MTNNVRSSCSGDACELFKEPPAYDAAALAMAAEAKIRAWAERLHLDDLKRAQEQDGGISGFPVASRGGERHA